MLNSLPLAYKFVATALMLTEINYCASQLSLPMDLPIRQQDVRFQFLSDPTLIGFGGRIDTEKYSFSFSNSGKLRFITRVDEREGLSLRQYQEKMSHLKSKIGKKDAYHLAKAWLRAVDVDVDRLEKDRLPKAEQLYFLAPGDGKHAAAGRRNLPLFCVTWGDRTDPAIRVSLSGVTGELLFLRQEDGSYSRRPAELIKDLSKLLAIPDEEFTSYSATQRDALVAKFAAVSRNGPEQSLSTTAK